MLRANPAPKSVSPRSVALVLGAGLLATVAACGDNLAPGDRDAGIADPTADAAAVPRRPRVILMIGDGMGKGQLELASRYRHGEPEKLFVYSLPNRGQLTSGSLSGITDSAASATLMASGVRTYNAYIGVDRDQRPVETLVETAKALGLGTGVVTTSYLPHATPASFTAHRGSRNDTLGIADDQVRDVQADIMLGGGTRFYLPAGDNSNRTDEGLIGELNSAGYSVIYDAAALAAVPRIAETKLMGLFAPEHLDYVADRGADTTQPTLTEMSLAALELLDLDEDGFFVMIEGARIDMACHNNDAERALHETLAFDDAVATVTAWAAGRDDVTLIVTADHETGGMVIDQPATAGVVSPVSWRWGTHTNAQIDVFALGRGTDSFDGKVGSHADVYAALRAAVTGEPVVTPARVLVPDGNLRDLRFEAVSQVNASGFGLGYNELTRLKVDADDRGLAIGIEGVFEWDKNAVVILLDIDHGAGTGVTSMDSQLLDTDGVFDAVVSGLSISGSADPGFGAELAIGSFGGADPKRESLWDTAGVRGLVAPYGDPADLGWLAAAVNFGENVRSRTGPLTVTTDEGFETFLPWEMLYPNGGGMVPVGATLALTALLVGDDGGYTSNQALPPFAADTDNPGRTVVPLPGIIQLAVDADLDGVVDSSLAPTVLSP